MRFSSLPCTLSVCLLLLLLSLPSSCALVVKLGAHSESCFFEHANKQDKIVGNMRVVSGGALDVDLKILDPGNKVVFEQSRLTEDSFQFYAGLDGLYKFCFSNAMSVVSGKAVSFSIFVGARLNQKDAAKPQHFSGLEAGVTKLAQSIREVKDWNSHMKTRERVHHATVESTATRVWAWRIVQIACVLAVAFIKVAYLRNMFESKRGA